MPTSTDHPETQTSLSVISPIAFFIPDQIGLLVTDQNAGAQLRERLSNFIGLINEQLKRLGYGEVKLSLPEPQDILFYPGKTPRVPRCEPGKQAMSPSARLEVSPSDKLQNRWPGEVPERDPFVLFFSRVERAPGQNADLKPSELLRLVAKDLEAVRKDLSPEALDGLQWQASILNWLGSSLPPGAGGTGGPGGPPVPYCGDPRNLREAPPFSSRFAGANNSGFPETLEDILGIATTKWPEYCGAGIEVALLDTAPSVHDLADAYRAWTSCGLEHPLLRRLLGPDGKLSVQHASFEEILRLSQYPLLKHPYKMTDHGLFVAGIVNTIAPDARLTLIEALNPAGVCDYESVYRGLLGLALRSSQRNLIINCSLGINIPIVDSHIGYAEFIAEAAAAGFNEAAILEWIRTQQLPLDFICDVLFTQGSFVIAAAGNDNRLGAPQRPQARVPAALEMSYGIGALSRLNPAAGGPNPASYSNLSDRPPIAGVTTFGGEPGEGDGVLGVYVGRFPDESINPRVPTGWAWWAGTSFATPIVTGAVANLMSLLLSVEFPLSLAQWAIFLLDAAAKTTSPQTGDQEDVLAITQST